MSYIGVSGEIAESSSHSSSNNFYASSFYASHSSVHVCAGAGVSVLRYGIVESGDDVANVPS